MTTEKNKAPTETTDKKPKESFKLIIWLSFGFIVTFVFGYLGFLVYVSWPISEWSVSKAASLGDSFGILSSLFSGLAFAGLIVTIVMQNKTLKLQMEELREARVVSELQKDAIVGQEAVMNKQFEAIQVQQFETTFFKIIEFHRIAIKSNVFDFENSKLNGYELIDVLCVKSNIKFYQLNGIVDKYADFFLFYLNSVFSIFSYINGRGKDIEVFDAFFYRDVFKNTMSDSEFFLIFLMVWKGYVNTIPFGFFSSRNIFFKVPSLFFYDLHKYNYIKNIIKIVELENLKGLETLVANLLVRKVSLKKIASNLEFNINESTIEYKVYEKEFEVCRQLGDMDTNDEVIKKMTIQFKRQGHFGEIDNNVFTDCLFAKLKIENELCSYRKHLTDTNELISELDKLELTFAQS